MDFQYDKKTKDLLKQVKAFMLEHLYPLEKEYREYEEKNPDYVFPKMQKLKDQARAEGLWNLFLPEDYKEFSPGSVSYTHLTLPTILLV